MRVHFPASAVAMMAASQNGKSYTSRISVARMANVADWGSADCASAAGHMNRPVPNPITRYGGCFAETDENGSVRRLYHDAPIHEMGLKTGLLY